MKIVIIGAGIGGLTAALCAHHFGHDVAVLEQAATLGEVGAGIQIPPNAMKIFQALGIDNLILEKAFRPQAIELRMGVSGRTIFNVPLSGQAVQRWGAPYLHIHRADYIAALRTSLMTRAPKAMMLGAKAKTYRQNAAGVTVSMQGGAELSADILIGADGIKSNIRTAMLGEDKAIFTGNVAWRAVVPIKALGEHIPNPTACAWVGKGRHAVTYHLRGGTLANFVGVVERGDWTDESWSEIGDKLDAIHDFAGWHPVITNLIQSVEAGALYRWALFDRPPLERWTDGRAALLGDAAHPMLPFLAQGAAMAVEDSWALAQEISKTDRSVEMSLKAYERRRLPRTSRAQAASRANMKIFHQKTRLGQIKTYGPMWLAGQVAPSIIHSRMNWLYGHELVAE